VVTRAGVTENDFDEIFPAFEDCYRAAYEQGLDRLSGTVTTTADRRDGWLERVRSGLVALLGFFDDHPSWARVLVLEAPVNASVAFDCRQRLHDVLACLLDHHQPAGTPAGSPLPTPALTGELIVGGVFSVIRTSMLENDGGKLVELAPSLMAFIVAPYLGQGAARAELEGSPYGRSNAPATEPGIARARAISRAAKLPVRATHRTTLVLRAIARTPYLNNREVAQAAGLADEGQASKLLARLEGRGVIENVGVGAARGEPNAWLLTPSGQRTVELIDESVAPGGARPRSARARDAA
jgi:AcrR family transcriptional regulator